jgi:hypothetical protein
MSGGMGASRVLLARRILDDADTVLHDTVLHRNLEVAMTLTLDVELPAWGKSSWR